MTAFPVAISMPLIDLSQLRQALGPTAGRFDVDALDDCSSTNALLLERAVQGAPAGTVLVADRQSAGRGRRGRPWASSPQDSLTFSLLWRWQASPARLAGLSLAAGLALARGLEALGFAPLGLKWPNDLYAAGPEGEAKLGGILVELVADRRGTQAVIGIGLNLRPPAPGLLEQPAAGLAQLGPLPERHLLLATLLTQLAATLDVFEQQGFAPLRPEWQRRHVWQGRRVCLLEEGHVLAEGRCLGADPEGSLLLETGAGVQRFLAGDVSLRPR
ncbi:biotin--[acetyl-CoA-carboxylase] ligase [Azovibrio restrictus]|uniref:biotin--[acetyl-CoA-carboxylase] ligase n=1 Tax=Azovibrio restrictus TaxID=146938 RepID=UPI0026F0F245|nr:biotin--[acetyl-CoA-carboxylase] ligase [Azovibrio restrictus]